MNSGDRLIFPSMPFRIRESFCGSLSCVAWSRKSSPPEIPSPWIAGGVTTLMRASGAAAVIARILPTIASSFFSGVFLLDHSSSAKMTEPTFSPESPAKLKPAMLMTDRTPGICRNCGTSLFNSASVRPWVAPSGSWTSANTAPWSSSGTNDDGVIFMIATESPTTRAKSPTVTMVRRAIHIAPLT